MQGEMYGAAVRSQGAAERPGMLRGASAWGVQCPHCASFNMCVKHSMYPDGGCKPCWSSAEVKVGLKREAIGYPRESGDKF